MQTIWLEAFIAVVDHKGFAAASAYLYRSQGRVSSYIAELEAELGVRLFDRAQRPARLTSEGSAFLPYARDILEALDSGKTAALAVQGLIRGDVALATYPSASAEFVPDVLRRFSAHYPNVSVQLVERSIRGLDQAIESGDTWVMIRPTIPPPLCRIPISYKALWREQMCLVVPDSHPLAGHSTATPGDLADCPLVMGGPNSREAELSRMLTVAGIAPAIKYLSDQPQTVVALARNGLAVGVINVLALRSIRLDGVSVVPLTSDIMREVGVYWTAATSASAAATALLETISRTPPPPNTTDVQQAGHDLEFGSIAPLKRS